MEVKKQEKVCYWNKLMPTPFKKDIGVVFAQTAQNITLQIADMKGWYCTKKTIGNVSPLQEKVITLENLSPEYTF